MKNDYRARIAEAVRICGGQSALARKINAAFGMKVSPQNIQYLVDTRRDKPAQGSRLTPQIAAVSGLSAQWLASGKGNKFETQPVLKQAGDKIRVREAPTVEVEEVELPRAAIELAQAWLALPENERQKFKRTIEAAALQHRGFVPDAQLRHLAAPKAKKTKSKAGTQ